MLFSLKILRSGWSKTIIFFILFLYEKNCMLLRAFMLFAIRFFFFLRKIENIDISA